MKSLTSFAGKVAILVISALPFAMAAGDIIIDIKSDPSLPLTNFVRNGGFEEGMKNWSVAKSEDNGWEVKLSDESFSGKHSLYVKVTNEGRHHGRGAFQSLGYAIRDGLMQKGRTYCVSCWIKVVNASNVGGEYCGPGAVLSFTSPDWKKSSVANARGGDTGGGWRQLISGPVKYEDWAQSAQIVGGISYSTGEMWIDDICVTEADLKINIDVHGGPFRQVLLEGGDGEILFDSGRLPEGTDSFSKSLQTSCYKLFTVSVVGNDGSIARKVLDGTPVKQNPLMVLDGKPFFPIGTEVIGYEEKERDAAEFKKICEELKEAGFNTIADYTATQKRYPFNPGIAVRNLKIAGENNIKMLIGFHDACVKRKTGETGDDLIRGIIKACKDEPALMGYWIIDEPRPDNISDAEKFYHLAKSLDKDHIVYTNISPFGYKPTGDEEFADVISGDGYPIHKLPEYGEFHDKYITAIADCFMNVTRPFGGKKPAFYWVQGFGESRTESHACPTYEQIRFMTYDIIVHGASGIFFWISSTDGRPPWSDVKRVAAELRDLYPALTAPDAGAAVGVRERNSKVKTYFRSCGAKAYVIAVNCGEEKQSATLILPVRFLKAKRLFEPISPLQIDSSFIHDDFDRYGCHVYEVELPQQESK